MILALRLLVIVVLLGLVAFLLAPAEAENLPEEVKAFKSIKARAEKGDRDAQFIMGVSYANGLGVAKDESESLSWYRKAAVRGHASAQNIVGNYYSSGLYGVKEDKTEAVRWYRKAADQGHAQAQFSLGGHYDFGWGVARDEKEAVKWYRESAERGVTLAQLTLGMRFSSGKGVAKDETEAVRWYRKAADSGDAYAQLFVGISYANGFGVPKDAVEAYAYYNLAGISDEDARKRLAQLENEMSRDEIAAAQKRSRELQKEIEAKMAAEASRR